MFCLNIGFHCSFAMICCLFYSILKLMYFLFLKQNIFFSETQKVFEFQISHSIVSISDQTRQFSTFMIYLILYKNRWYLSIRNKHINAYLIYDTILFYH